MEFAVSTQRVFMYAPLVRPSRWSSKCGVPRPSRYARTQEER